MEKWQEDEVWVALWKTQLPLEVQEFIYKLLCKKITVAYRVKMKEVKTECPWCDAKHTKIMLVHAIRCLGQPRVENKEVEQLVKDTPLAALRSKEGVVLLWGIHKRE